MKIKRIALVDKYGDGFTEGDNFVGYAKGFLNRGFRVSQLDPYTVDFESGSAKTYRISETVGGISRGSPEIEKVESFDVVMDLSDIIDYDFAKRFSDFNVFHINDPLEMYNSADKRTYVKRYSEFIPETIVSSDVDELKRTLDNFGGVMIVKEPFGSCGFGVEKVSKDDDYVDVFLKMTNGGRKEVVAQKFMSLATEGSKRVAVVGKVGDDASYRIVHYYGRRPEAGGWRDNLSQGGSVVELGGLRNDEVELCLNVARKSGLYLVGLDIMDDVDEDGNRVSRLVETNSVLAIAKGRYPEKLREVVDFIVDELLK